MKCSIWIHRSWNLIWIHNMNSDMNSWSWKISRNHKSELMYMNSSKNSGCWNHIWIHIMITSLNWCYEEYCEIMAEFQESYESWLNSLILNWSGFSFKSVFSGNKFYSSKEIMTQTPSLQPTHCQPCCCSMATGLCCCRCRRLVLLRAAEWAGLEGLDDSGSSSVQST